MASGRSKGQSPNGNGDWLPHEIFQFYCGLPVPDPITFICAPDYCNRNNLYPRQATLLKIIFLREDLFTDYDYAVLEEWEDSFRKTNNNGINPDILGRMRRLRADGRKWFKEVLLVMGRRAGKGHISGLSMSYVLWNYMAKGDPQYFYGVDRDKKLTCLVFAGKKQQARDNVWSDIQNVVLGSNCFIPYVSSSLSAELSIYAPSDFIKMRELQKKGIVTTGDQATFQILPKESTSMAGRGTAAFMQAYDEMAHVTATNAKEDASVVYESATPALDQFGKDGFIVEPSSPWQMIGKFYENYQRSTEVDEETGDPVYDNLLMVQLTSWDIYKDWERAHEIPMFPDGFKGDLEEYDDGEPLPNFKRLRGAIQEYDDEMRLLERSNPDTFKVERRSHFATALDAYLDENHIDQMFQPWKDRAEDQGPRTIIQMYQGRPDRTYKAHGDPSKVNDFFGFAVAHREMGPNNRWHVVFDRIHHWDPADFPEHTIDYDQIENEIWDTFLTPFQPYETTFDQFNSAQIIGNLKKRVRKSYLPKADGMNIYERTATRPENWIKAEIFKAALNMHMIHAPYYEQLDLELKFLQKKPNVDVVDHPSAGPVQSKDVADAVFDCVYALIGDQIISIREELSAIMPQGMAAGGFEAFPGMSRDDTNTFSQLGRSIGGRGVAKNPAYGGFRTGGRNGTRGARIPGR